MCKFTNRLFVFVLLTVILYVVVVVVDAAPCSKKRKNCSTTKEQELSDLDDHDIYIDQRQKGSENFRLKMDGFFLGAKQPSSSDLISLGDILLGELGEELMFGLADERKNSTQSQLNLLNFKDFNARGYKKPTAANRKMPMTLTKDDASAREDLKEGSDKIEAKEESSRTKLAAYRLIKLLGQLQETN